MKVVKKLIRFSEIENRIKNKTIGIKEFEDFLNQDEDSWIKDNLSEKQQFDLSIGDRSHYLKEFKFMCSKQNILEFEKFLKDPKAWMKNNLSNDRINQIEKVKTKVLQGFFSYLTTFST